MMINKQLISTFSVLLITALIMPTKVFASDEKAVIINSGSSEPLIFSTNKGFYSQIIQEVFSRLNISSQVMHLPSSASLKNANLGIDDGVIGRIKGIDKKFTNLIRVPEKVIDLNFAAYSNDKNIKIEKWEDLKPYNIGYIRGWKIFDKKATSYRSLVKVKNTNQLFLLLKNKRVDVILHQDIPAKYRMKKLGYFPHQHEPFLDSREMFIYMHKHNSALVPQMVKKLKEIKQYGTYQQLYDKYIIDVVTPISQKSNPK